jgi:AcrR family transcriptional regulator
MKSQRKADVAEGMSERKSKIQPRWPTRADGRARFAHLLDTLEQMLEVHPVAAISIQAMAAAAHMPTSSVYHFFPTVQAAFFALASRHVEQLEVLTSGPVPPEFLDRWSNMFRFIADRSRDTYNDNPKFMRLFLGADLPDDVRSETPAVNLRFGGLMRRHFAQTFSLPALQDFDAICAYAIEIMNLFWRISFERSGMITQDLHEEGLRASLAYMKTYLPENLAPRAAPDAPADA